jgi:hypothetical protein
MSCRGQRCRGTGSRSGVFNINAPCFLSLCLHPCYRDCHDVSVCDFYRVLVLVCGQDGYVLLSCVESAKTVPSGIVLRFAKSRLREVAHTSGGLLQLEMCVALPAPPPFAVV